MEKKKVLLVEDDFMLSLIAKKYIELIGHQLVASVTNAEEAIKAARAEKPDVIVMDIRLEGKMDGIDAMTEIAKFSSVPVIYLSGSSDEENKNRASKTNMLAFCVKPIQLEQLQEYFAKI
jgi:two-component system, response regulator PdtaR